MITRRSFLKCVGVAATLPYLPNIAFSEEKTSNDIGYIDFEVDWIPERATYLHVGVLEAEYNGKHHCYNAAYYFDEKETPAWMKEEMRDTLIQVISRDMAA